MQRNKPNSFNDKHKIPLEEWNDYLDVSAISPDEMMLGELLELKKKLLNELDKIDALIKSKARKKQSKRHFVL